MEKTEKRWRRIIEEVLFFLLGCFLGIILLAAGIWWVGYDMILPKVYVAGVNLGGQNQTEAVATLWERANGSAPSVRFNEVTWQLPGDVYTLEIEQAVEKANAVGRSWNKEQLVELVTGRIDIPLSVSLNEEKYAYWSGEIASGVAIVSQPATVKVVGKDIVLTNGEDGISLDEGRMRMELTERLQRLDGSEMQVPVVSETAALNQEQVEKITSTAEELIGDTLTIKIEDEQVYLGGEELVSFLSLSPESIGEVDRSAVMEYVEGLSERFDRDPQDAKFEFDGGRVQEFAPGRDGIVIDKGGTVEELAKAVKELVNPDEKSQQVAAKISRTSPKISTGEVNNLGINERIGRGDSYYAHSIANRIYNVGLASSRVSGALVAPGEEFSFNQFVGEISGETGYKTAYVISGGRTVLGDGGGVCQVSTTLFRAVMDAGLPITERWAHAYRVGYYEQNSKPGVDATVYSPSKDFKFVNNTPNYILIQATNDPKNVHLIFEIYGTSDGRVSKITEPKVWGITPPPPDLYEDDPNLPAGTVKQVDWAAWGAKTSFDYTVTRGEEVIFEKTYNSNFRPWQNVFLRGTGG